MQRHHVIVFAGLIVLGVFFLTSIWEFGLEGGLDTPESVAEHWEYVLTATVAAAVAVAVPVPFALSTVAERSRAEAELRASQNHYRDLIELAPDLILLHDGERVLSANPAAARLLGRTRESLAGMSVRDLVHPDEWAEVAARAERLRCGESSLPYTDRRMLRADGSVVHVWAAAIPVTVNGRQVVLSIARDITERKRAEAALRRGHEELEALVAQRTADLVAANQALEREIAEHHRTEAALRRSEQILQEQVAELEKAQRNLEERSADLVQLAGDLRIARDDAEAANRAKSEFLANMSHELRTPLNAVIGFSDIMKQEAFGPLGSERYRDYAVGMNDAGKYLLELINDILDLAKIESGTESLNEEDVDVAGVVGAVERLVRERARRREVALAVEVQDGLPRLRADERQIKQILANLVSNGVKFTEAGGTVTLRAAIGPHGGHLFEVADTGVGIAAEDIPKALAHFGQVDSGLNRRHEGTGLGLPLSRALAEQHGGSFEIESEPGVGTRVIVRMPARRVVGCANEKAGEGPRRAGSA